MNLTREWVEQKAEQNLRKHQVDFEEAKTVFGDAYATAIPDPQHFASESRHNDIVCSSRRRRVADPQSIHELDHVPNLRLVELVRATR